MLPYRFTAHGSFYRPLASEVTVFEHAYAQRQPLRTGRPAVGKVASSVHGASLGASFGDGGLSRRHLHSGLAGSLSCARWRHRFGIRRSVVRAVPDRTLLYLDEIAEAREDVIAVLHPLSDHRRQLFLDRRDETLAAPPSLRSRSVTIRAISSGSKLKPSLRQRFVSLSFGYPDKATESGNRGSRKRPWDASTASKLVNLAPQDPRDAKSWNDRSGVDPTAGGAARLIVSGLPPRRACDVTRCAAAYRRCRYDSGAPRQLLILGRALMSFDEALWFWIRFFFFFRKRTKGQSTRCVVGYCAARLSFRTRAVRTARESKAENVGGISGPSVYLPSENGSVH